MLLEFVQETVVEGEALFIWLFFVPIWEDPRPGDREAVDTEAHLSEQLNVLGVAVVVIDAD